MLYKKHKCRVTKQMTKLIEKHGFKVIKKKAVLIQHGNYISVYKNLDNVTVQKGELVKTKQEIGKIHTDKTTGKTILAFVLFKEIKRENPEEWVYKI